MLKYQANGKRVTDVIGDIVTLLFPHVPGIHPNPLNLVTVNGCVLIPHQHSIRVTPSAATRILLSTFKSVALPTSSRLRLPAKGIEHLLVELAKQHPCVQFHLPANKRFTIADIAKAFSVSDELDDVAAHLALEVIKQVGAHASLSTIISGPKTFSFDACGTVDILEACIYVTLSAMGHECHFIETSFLSYGGGNLHCATNRIPLLDTLRQSEARLLQRMLDSSLHKS